MADHGYGGRSRRDGPGGLAAALRREARAERPVFSASLHDRVVGGVARSRPKTVRRRRRAATGGFPALVGVSALAACAALVVGVAWLRPASESAEPVVVAAVPGIERLPTFDEIGEGVLAEVTTFAAAAVGVPDLADLAAFDPAVFVAADDAGR